jgi:hypothetical protein
VNLFLLATLAMMDKFLSGYKRKDRENKAGWNENNEANSRRRRYVKT